MATRHCVQALAALKKCDALVETAAQHQFDCICGWITNGSRPEFGAMAAPPARLRAAGAIVIDGPRNPGRGIGRLAYFSKIQTSAQYSLAGSIPRHNHKMLAAI